MPYLPNIASPLGNLYSRSIRSVCEDLIRGESLGASYLVLHLGSRSNSNQSEAIGRISEAINKVFEQVKNKVVLLLENTAGQGREVGYTFLQIKAIIDKIECKNRIGICLDTAHAFEAGYDLSKRKGLKETVKEFDSLVGLNKLHLLHLNDSRTCFRSHIDRHWHIGEGYIGILGFRRIVNHPQLSHLPAIMETPRKNEEDDLKNMSVVRGLIGTRNVNRI